MKKILLLLVACYSFASAGLAGAEEPKSIQFLDSAPTSLPFSEAVRVGNLLYLSGQVGFLPGTRNLAAGGIEAESRQTMENIRASLKAHGYSMSDVVKCTVVLADMSEYGVFNEVYKSFFTKPYPGRSALGANGLAFGARVEVECIAAKGKEKGRQANHGDRR